MIVIVGGAWFAYTKRTVEAPVRTDSIIRTMNLTSSAFTSGGAIPAKYTCDGDNLSPPLTIDNPPKEAKSFVLVMDDPDIPQVFKEQRGIDAFDHWTVFNISPDTRQISENVGEALGTLGKNGAGNNAYTGPCPPPQYEPKEHRYFFTLHALDTTLDISASSTKAEVLAATEGHSIADATLMGRYQRASE